MSNALGLTLDDLIMADLTGNRPERGIHCPAQIRLSIGSTDLIFERRGDAWRLSMVSTYGNLSMAVSGVLAPEMVDYFDASGPVVIPSVAEALNELAV